MCVCVLFVLFMFSGRHKSKNLATIPRVVKDSSCFWLPNLGFWQLGLVVDQVSSFILASMTLVRPNPFAHGYTDPMEADLLTSIPPECESPLAREQQPIYSVCKHLGATGVIRLGSPWA